MNKKRLSLIIGLALILIVSIFAYSIYSEVRFEIPTEFGDLENFVGRGAQAYLELPNAVESFANLEKTTIGRSILEGGLARDFLIGPLTDQVRFFSRRLQNLTGLDFAEAALKRIFSQPFAVALYNISHTDRAAVAIIKVRTSDALIASLAGKLGAAVLEEGELSETRWKEKSIFGLGEGSGAVYFALVNDVLLISPEIELIKLSIQNASLAKTRDLPPTWNAFLERHPLEKDLMARVWLRRDFVEKELPLIELALPKTARSDSLGLAFFTSPKPRFEASWDSKDDSILTQAIIGQLPSGASLVLGDGDFLRGSTWLDSSLLSQIFNSTPKADRERLEGFLKALPGGFALVFDGFKGNARGTWPSLRLVWDAKTGQADAWIKLETFVKALPGVRLRQGSHKGVGYTLLVGGENSGFDPGYARFENTIVIALDEPSLKNSIDLAKGAQKLLIDSPLFGEILGGLRRESLTHFSHIEARALLGNLYQEMGEHAFRSRAYTRREVADAFGDLVTKGPGFESLSLVAGREQGYIRAKITLR